MFFIVFQPCEHMRKHAFAGQNTQHPFFLFCNQLPANTTGGFAILASFGEPEKITSLYSIAYLKESVFVMLLQVTGL